MNTIVKIAFCDFWPGFDEKNNFITKVLDGKVNYDVVLDSNEVDFVFCSVFGHKYLDFSCPRICYSGENVCPDFNAYDYGIGFDFIDIGDRYIRYPLYIHYEEDCNKMVSGNTLSFEEATNRDFCSMVVSNGSCADPMRDIIFDALCGYKKVSSGGRYRNNIGLPQGVESKEEFTKKHKFSLAYENSSHPGYCTEKILQAFAYGTVPIYWGDPFVDKYFNPDAFINANSFSDVNDLVEYIKKVDSDDELYYQMLNAKKIINKEFEIQNMKDEFTEWLCRVISQEGDKAYRRSLYGWVMSKEMNNKYYFKMLDKIEKRPIRLFAKLLRRVKSSIVG